MKLESILLLCFLKFAWATFLKNVTSEVFGDDVQYLPAAFGDFNSDKLTVSYLDAQCGTGKPKEAVIRS